MKETTPFLTWICHKHSMDFDTDNPHGCTPSVTTTTEHVLACITQVLPSSHEGPAIGSLHAMQPTPHLGLGLEAETIDQAPTLAKIQQQHTFPVSAVST